MIEIISYWFFIWFILYIIGIIKYNPLWFLIIGYIITIFEFLYLNYKNTNNYNLIKYLIINIIIKLIPIIIILNLTMYNLSIQSNDIKFGMSIIMIYIIIIASLNINPINSYNEMLNTYINDDNNYKTYISRLYDDIYNFWTYLRICL